MKRILLSVVSCAMILALVLGAASLLTVGAETANGTQPTTYSSTYNSGTRHVVCTTLDGTDASDYYTGAYTYDSLSTLSDDELLASLRNLMTSTHAYTATYNDSRDMAPMTDCQGEDGTVVLLYTSYVATFADFIGSGSVGWNREHVWPKSLGGFDKTGAGADLHHVRPDDVTTNADRGNLKYGNVENGQTVKGSSLVSRAVGGESGGGYFEPLDNVKGDVARICLYVYARYGGEISQCASITNVFESVDVLLEWCESDPVDTWEMGRNEVVASKQGNRNVFIDYPELAWLIFDREIPADMVTPSGEAANVSTETDTEAESTDTLPAETEPADTEPATDPATEPALTEGTTPSTDEPESQTVPDVTTVEETEEETTEHMTIPYLEPSTGADNGCGASLGVSMVTVAVVSLGAATVLRRRKD